MNRREFVKAMAALGIGVTLSGSVFDAFAQGAESTLERVPTRPFGKSGRQVSVLTLGTMFDIPSNQLLLKRAVELGVTCWDTAAIYEGGDSEKGIGKYLKRHPADREKLFLVTKSRERKPAGIMRDLNRSLRRMQTDHVDLFYLHAVDSSRELRDELAEVGAKAKAAGKIRLFGFSSHSNVEDLLLVAPSLGWVDGILHSYNIGLMGGTKMEAGVAACHRAGIGLTAMKIGRMHYDPTNPQQHKLMKHHLDAGFSEAQARLRAVLSDERIASAAVTLKNMELLESNAAATMGRTKL